jgi:hypothetical protein
MAEYRRAPMNERKNDLWHFHPDCSSYPSRSFAIGHHQPTDDDLCAKCASLSGGGRMRSAA